LVCSQASHAKSKARQNFGEGIVRPRFASAWAQKQAWRPKIWLGFDAWASVQTPSNHISQRQLFGKATAGYNPNSPQIF
jgi:hypothetical protein